MLPPTPPQAVARGRGTLYFIHDTRASLSLSGTQFVQSTTIELYPGAHGSRQLDGFYVSWLYSYQVDEASCLYCTSTSKFKYEEFTWYTCKYYNAEVGLAVVRFCGFAVVGAFNQKPTDAS